MLRSLRDRAFVHEAVADTQIPSLHNPSFRLSQREQFVFERLNVATRTGRNIKNVELRVCL
jgi:hypothetical protein